jgi:hypothetical protein
MYVFIHFTLQLALGNHNSEQSRFMHSMAVRSFVVFSFKLFYGTAFRSGCFLRWHV